MDGHASNAPETLSDLASFLGDTPEQESQDEDVEALADESTDELDTDESETVGQEESDDGEPSEDEEADETPAPDRKIKVPVKGDDGTDQEIEVDESELVKSYMRQSDYTRKTQEVAEIRRQTEAEKQMIAQEREFIQHNLKDVATVTALDQQIAQYQGVNWDQLTESDPVQAMKLERQLRNLQSQREQAAAAVTQRQAHFVQMQQQEAARQLQEGQRVLQREIPGWNESLARELVDYGLKRGYAPEVLQNIRNPQFVIDLHNSYQFTKLREKAAQKPKVLQEKPVTRIQATKATATKDPDSMSAEEWAKWRNAQLRKKR